VPGDAFDSIHVEVIAIDKKLSNAVGSYAIPFASASPFRIAFFITPFSRLAVGTGNVPAFENRMWGP
jgi:hypothetical protein